LVECCCDHLVEFNDGGWCVAFGDEGVDPGAYVRWFDGDEWFVLEGGSYVILDIAVVSGFGGGSVVARGLPLVDPVFPACLSSAWVGVVAAVFCDFDFAREAFGVDAAFEGASALFGVVRFPLRFGRCRVLPADDTSIGAVALYVA
jgi:hypothetical protein